MPSADGFVQAPQGGYQCLAPTGSCRHLYVPIIAFVSASRCPEVPVGAERAYRRGGLLGLDCLRFPAYSELHCGAVAVVGCVYRSGIPAVRTHYLVLRVVRYAVPKMESWAVVLHERELRG